MILQWHKMFGINNNNVERDVSNQTANEEGHNGTQHTFLTQLFHGSRRHLRMLASNALTIVSEMGRPTIFLTLTCNIHWPEIDDQLLEGQTAYGNIIF